LVRVRIECGRGTYIRAIARDLGERLGVGRYLTELRRTFVGKFLAAEGVKVEELTGENVESYLRSVE
jgi:tRNA pseudouridine55 synthase